VTTADRASNFLCAMGDQIRQDGQSTGNGIEAATIPAGQARVTQLFDLGTLRKEE